MKKVTVIIGEEYPSKKVTLQWPEYKLLPDKFIPLVAKHISEIDEVVIRTCSSEVVNFIGCCIDDGTLNHVNCVVIFEGNPYNFSSDGVLHDWPFGCLEMWDFHETEKLLRK